MKIAYVTEYGNWLKNQMFIETASCNVNNVLDRYIALKGFLEQQGVHLNTFDMYGSISEVDIWLMQEPTPAILEFILKNNIDPSRVIYFLHEPPVYNYWGWDYIRKSHYLYEAVLTWETTSTKANRKFFHYHFPVKFDPAKREHYLKKEKKNLCFIMHSNKTSQVPGELYSFRRNVITYFEKRGDRLLDLYGHGWNSDKAPSPFFTDLYKGTTPDKRETYAEYHFSICIDNCISPGYITYDPLISMITGTVPVYIPMPDAKEYIPEDTFIDMSRFKTLEELTDRLLSIRGTDTYEQIRKSGWEFVTSERYHPFTVEKFSKDVFAAIRYVGERLSSRKNGKAAMVPPEKAQKYLNPHFTGFLPMQNGIRYDEMDPALFFSHKRFDLPAKYIYVKHREMGVGSDWARRMYSEHIRAFNGYREPDGSGKEGKMAFIDSFDAIIDSVRAKGFDESMSMVPVTHSGDLIEGSHRVAACMYYRIPLKTLGFSFDTWAYPYSFFLERGLSREHCDAIAYEHCKLKENTYLVLLFPSAVGRDEEVRTILQRYGSILYEKEVRLFNNGPLLLMTQIYKNENWLGDISNNFGGARLKVQECFRTDSPLRVLLIETDNPQKLKDAKDEIRAVYRISNHSVHINDTHEETVRVSQLLFNENSIHFLNHATPAAFPRFQRHYGTLRQFCAGKDLDEMELLCLTGSSVMALYGIRDARDIDYFHFRDALPEDPSGGLGSHNKEIRHYTMTRDDIIFNPENHFYFDGFKFASLEVVRAMKEKRDEEKDRVDIELIRNFPGMDSKGTSPQQGPGPNRPKTSPVVSVIILNYNGFEDLRLCIDSISRNTSEPYEIVVFDNASTDNSLPYLRTLPGVHLVESPVNLGCPAGRAQAMTHIHPASRYVIFLDNDTIVTKGWTTKFIAHAQRDPSIGMMGPRSNYVSGAQLVRGAAYSNVGELESFAAQWSDQAGEALTPTLRLVGFCMFITRDVIDKIGSIDASFGKFGFEDDDYTWRTVVAGFKAMIANNVFIHHKGGPQGQGNMVYNEALFTAWETFKNKWGIPKEVSYGSSFDISAVLTRPYNADRDHIPLVLKRDGGASLDEAFARAKEATDRGDVDGAIAVFNKLLINDPDSGVVHAALGTLFAGKKEYGKARDSFIKALTAMPSETGLCLQLADVCVQLNEPGNARQILEAALSQKPGNAEIIARLVDVMVASGQSGEAVETVKNALLKDPKNPDLIAIFGHLAAVIGNRDALKTCIEKLREIDPSHRAVDILTEISGFLQSEPPIDDELPGTRIENEYPMPLVFVKRRDYSLNPEFLKKIQEIFQANVFIETGTFRGNTTIGASRLFREVHTVELDESNYRTARSRFEGIKNIHAHHGDSAALLPGIIEKVEGKIIFWLDGHYSGEGTAKSDKEIPIIEEIGAIARSGKKDSVILVDDIRLFLGSAMFAGADINDDYPSLNKVCDLVRTIDENYQCAVFGDILIAYNDSRFPFSPLVKACTISRLYDGSNYDEETLFAAENSIRSAQGKELSAIEILYSVFMSPSLSSGYFRLWFALTAMDRNEYEAAAKEFLGLIAGGFSHWRMSLYLAEAYLNTGKISEARGAIEKALAQAPENIHVQRLYKLTNDSAGVCGTGHLSPPIPMDAGEQSPSPEIAGGKRSISPAVTDRGNGTAGALPGEKEITIIMVLPEGRAGLKECLRSVVEHSGKEGLEFLFITKALSKKTDKLIRQTLGNRFEYRLTADEHNRGFVHLVNEGIGQSAGEFILLLDPSTVVTDGWLQGMKDCFRYAADTGIAGPMTNHTSQPQQVIKADLAKFGGGINEFAGAFRAQNLHRRFNVFRLSSFCMLFKREFIHRIGLLDPSFDYLLMPWDIDLSIRCSLAGSKNTVAADVYVHRYSYTRPGDTAALLSKWNGADPETGRKLTVLAAIERSQLLFERGKIKDAVDALIEAIKSAPDHRDIYLCLARILIDSQAGAEAFDALQAMPDSEKDSPEALELFGYATEALDLDVEADGYAERLLSARPGSGPALDLKGLLAYKKGEPGNAESFFRRAIGADPGFAEPYKNLGLLKWTSGEKEEGLALLEKAFVLAPTRNDNGVAYLSAVIDQETYERAEMILSEAKDLHPDSRNIALLFIDLLLRQEKTGAAMSETEKCLVRFGADEGLVNVGLDIRGRLGPLTIDPGKARQGTLSLCMIVKNEEKNIGRSLMSLAPVVDEIIVVDTGSTDGTRDIASIFGAQVLDFAWTNDFSEARNVSLSHARGRWILVHDADEVISARDHDKLRAIIRENPRQSVAYTLVTRNYTTNPSLGGWTENKGEYPDEESGTGWIPTSKVRLLINDERFRFENPIHEMLEPSLWHAGAEIRSCDVPVHHYGKLDEAKMHEKADMYYLLGKKKLLDADSINLGALRELAVQAAELHRYEEAILLWERYIALEPGNHKAFFNISTCYFETGQFGKALDAAKKALEIDPSSKEAVLGYASVSLCVGDVDEAVSLIEKLFRRTADYPPARVALAAAYFMKEMKEEGRKHLERLRSNNYNCSIALHSLVQKLISAGRTEYALCVLEMMEESGNTHQDSARLVRECRDNMVRKRTGTQ